MLNMSSAIRARGTSGRLVAKRSLSCMMRCASAIMPWMKLRWKDAREISCPLKVNDSSEIQEIDAGMLIRWDQKGVRLLGQIKTSTCKDVVRGREVDEESLQV